jgi:hypothetical protein
MIAIVANRSLMLYESGSAAPDASLRRSGLRIIRAMQPYLARGKTEEDRSWRGGGGSRICNDRGAASLEPGR